LREPTVEGERVQRRLAAILAADVAGYSRLTGADEEGTIARLRALRKELIDSTVASHGGRIVKTTGDGILIEFASVVEAVRCAIDVQRQITASNTDVPADRRIEFRIGVHVGDVVVEGDDLLGDGVNVAARLEGIAEPGAICLSGDAYRQVKGKIDLAVQDLGEQQLRNIAEPVHAYAVRPTNVHVVGAGRASSVHAPYLSIVVLPFVNLGTDRDHDYFVDGITENLTTDLSRIPGAFVISRNTAFTYKGKSVGARQIGHELGVHYALEGSVQRSADRVRVNVQLIDTETGAQIWADRVETERANLLEAQDAITSSLARSLNLELLADVSDRIERENSLDPDARDFIMRGWAWSNRPFTPANRREAQRAFERALEIDQRSVDARIGLASTLASYLAPGWTSSAHEDLTRAEQLLLEALERDANSASARQQLGRLRRLQNRLTESKIELEAAIALDRNSVFALRQLGQTLTYLGEPEAGMRRIEAAIRLSPRDPDIAQMYRALGVCHLLSDHVDQAIDFLGQARGANPRLWYIYYSLAGALGLKGALEEATVALAASIELKPEINSLAAWRTSRPWGNSRYWALYEKTVAAGLRKAGMPEV
jgi:adenylate cyclase